MSASRFSGRVALVTGGSHGIGLACARRFASEGARVVIADVDTAAGRTAAAELGALFVEADVGLKPEVERLFATAQREVGVVDILVSNAGIIRPGAFLDYPEEEFDRVIRTNLKSVFLCGQAAARAMVAAKKPGAIIHMSSINAVLAIPNQLPYVVSKGGVNQLTKVMALALAPHGIRVNGIGPGTIATEMAKGAVLGNAEARRTVLSRTPLGRLGEPEEIASVAAFLASDEASYMTGQTLYPDGGRLGLNYTVPVE